MEERGLENAVILTVTALLVTVMLNAFVTLSLPENVENKARNGCDNQL